MGVCVKQGDTFKAPPRSVAGTLPALSRCPHALGVVFYHQSYCCYYCRGFETLGAGKFAHIYGVLAARGPWHDRDLVLGMRDFVLSFTFNGRIFLGSQL